MCQLVLAIGVNCLLKIVYDVSTFPRLTLEHTETMLTKYAFIPSTDDVFIDDAFHVGQPEVPATIPEGQFLVV
jgi:hypothetical protein